MSLTRKTFWIASFGALLAVAGAPGARGQDAQAPDSKAPPAILPGIDAPQAPQTPPEAKPAALPGMTPKAKEPCPETPAKPGERKLEGCANPIRAFAEGYRDAYESLNRWAGEASDQLTAVIKKENDLQARIQENEAATTKLKLERSKANKSKLKDLARENKALWSELEGVQDERSQLCRGFSKAAGLKFKEIYSDLKARLSEVQSQMTK